MNRRALPWLPPALCELGVLLLLCGGTVFSLHGCGAEPKPRVLVMGWGGASWRIVEPLLELNQLPNLAALIARGETAELESVRPPASAAAWTSLSTGRHPGQTGVADWVATSADAPELVLHDSSSVQAPFAWEHLSGTGLRSFVFGAPLSAPARELDGILIAGAPVQSEDTWTYPPQVASDVKAAGILADAAGIVTPVEFSIEVFQDQLKKKRAFLLERMKRDDWDLGWIVFEELDELHRMCWPGPNENSLIDAYIALDSLLGELLAIAGEGTNVFVVSEHGTRLYGEALGVHVKMLGEGFAAVNGPIQPFVPPPNASRFEVQNAEYLHRLSGCEYQLTRAVASTCEGNVGSVRLTLQGKEPWAIAPFEIYDQVLEEVGKRFMGINSPRTLEPVFASTYRQEDLYPGEHSGRNPDLMIESVPDFLLTNDLILADFRLLDPQVAAPELAGIYIAAGPSIAHQKERGSHSILDVTPQVLKFFGLALSE